MAGAFADCASFQGGGVENWDTSRVTTLDSMFRGAVRFNAPVGRWNTRLVKDLSRTFQDCAVFNQPLNDWNVSSVKYMSAAFKRCTVFNQPLDRWVVGRVHNAGNMFKDATAFDQDLSGWKFNPHYGSERDIFSGTNATRDKFKPTVVYNPDDNWSVSSHESILDTDEQSDYDDEDFEGEDDGEEDEV